MKRWVFLWLVILSAPAFAQSVPVIRYESIPNAVRLPQNMYFGEVAGVAVNSKKHVFVFSRGNTTGPAFGAAASQLLEFAPDGKYLREIGRNLYAWAFAHTVRIDKQDNIWATDKGSDMVVKFTPEGRVDLVFGRKQEASDEAAPHKRGGPPPKHEDGRFRQPTDVTWDAAGNAFISDGYINSRIAKVDSTVTGSSPGASAAISRESSTRRTRSPRTLKAMFTSAIGATGAFKYSIATANICARSKSMSPSIATAPALPSATSRPKT